MIEINMTAGEPDSPVATQVPPSKLAGQIAQRALKRLGINGLHQVKIESRFKRPMVIFLLAKSRQRDQIGNVIRLLANCPRHGITIHAAGKSNVAEDDVGV